MSYSRSGNLAVVFAWLDGQRRGDVDAVEQLLAVDAVHHGVRPELVCRNRAEIVAQVRRGVDGRRGRAVPEVDAVELVAAGDDRVVLTVRGPSVGLPLDDSDGYRGQICIVFTIRSGVIAHMRAYDTRAEALLAAGAAPDWL
jgi:hypothetical protein